MEYNLKVTNPTVDGTTGHHTIEVVVIDDGGGEGVPEKYGIDLPSLDGRFGGDIEKWREWVGQEMLAKHLRRQQVKGEIAKWHGQKFAIPSEPADSTENA